MSLVSDFFENFDPIRDVNNATSDIISLNFTSFTRPFQQIFQEIMAFSPIDIIQDMYLGIVNRIEMVLDQLGDNIRIAITNAVMSILEIIRQLGFTVSDIFSKNLVGSLMILSLILGAIYIVLKIVIP
jgi:hypothetical protein